MAGDAIGTAARRVRLDQADAEVHELTATGFNAATGNVYRTRCGDELRAAAGAMLTTRDADCDECRGATMVRSGLIRTAASA